jgi:ABC-type long-subunit fatty acid transport system fused permease/ATPase subunit
VLTLQLNEILNHVSNVPTKFTIEIIVLLINGLFFVRIGISLVKALMIEIDFTPILLKIAAKLPTIQKKYKIKPKSLTVFLKWKLLHDLKQFHRIDSMIKGTI